MIASLTDPSAPIANERYVMLELRQPVTSDLAKDLAVRSLRATIVDVPTVRIGDSKLRTSACEDLPEAGHKWREVEASGWMPCDSLI